MLWNFSHLNTPSMRSTSSPVSSSVLRVEMTGSPAPTDPCSAVSARGSQHKANTQGKMRWKEAASPSEEGDICTNTPERQRIHASSKHAPLRHE